MSAACSPACGYCGACTAPWEREAEDDREPHHVDPVTTAVEVTNSDGGVWRFEHATADCFTPGALTITFDGGHARVFTADRWRDVTVFDPQGHPEFLITNPVFIASSAAAVGGGGV